MFNVGDSQVCYTLTVVDDNICEEPSENLFARLQARSENPVQFELQFTEVVIGDDIEPECG